jgi:SAM-dependent methyltransferase
MSDPTIEWYERNAKRYCAETVGIDLEDARRRFMSNVSPGGRLLDIGCGSGRDSMHFRQLGFEVDSRDASPAVAAEALRATGTAVRVQDIMSIEDEERFDGIWACASLLHLNPQQFETATAKLFRALRPQGVLFLSVKEGSGSATVDGRRFQYWMPDACIRSLDRTHPIELIDCWRAPDATRPNTKWINVLVRAVAPLEP